MRPVTCKISKCIWWRKETGALRAPFLCADMGKGHELCFWGSLQCTSHFFLDELWKHHGLHQMRYMEFRGGGVIPVAQSQMSWRWFVYLSFAAALNPAALFTQHCAILQQRPFPTAPKQYYIIILWWMILNLRVSPQLWLLHSVW